MQISSIVDIVEGVLLNSPSISFIYNTKTNLTKVHEGDLFVAKSENEIEQAIKKGAFAILLDFDTPIIDNEIAWIKVKNVKNAIIKLIRFKLINLNLEAFYCSNTVLSFIDNYKKTSEKEIITLSNNIYNELEILENIDNVQAIFCSNKKLLDDIYPNNKKFGYEKFEINNLIEHSLFETTFSYKQTYFSRLKLSSLYINEFLSLFEYFDGCLDLNRLKKLDFFKPLFIDKYFEIIEYGHSNKFILSTPDIQIAKKEINHLKEKYKYAKIIIIAKKDLSLQISANYYIDDLKEIKTELKNQKFNALYIVGFEKEEIEAIVEKNNNKLLF